MVAGDRHLELKHLVLGLVEDILESPNLWALVNAITKKNGAVPTIELQAPVVEKEPLPEYLPASQAAGLLRVARQTLAIWRCHGGGPPYIRLGEGTRGRVLYRVLDLEEWLMARRAAHTAEETMRAAERAGAYQPRGRRRRS
jgi:hypothetical protein